MEDVFMLSSHALGPLSKQVFASDSSRRLSKGRLPRDAAGSATPDGLDKSGASDRGRFEDQKDLKEQSHAVKDHQPDQEFPKIQFGAQEPDGKRPSQPDHHS